MRLHLPGLPHTVTHRRFSHCAFTNKVRLFAPMLRAEGFDVIHYGVAGAESGATEQVDLMTQAEHKALLGVEDYLLDPHRQVGKDALTDSATYRHFNYALREELQQRLAPGDALCLPLGPAHLAAYQGLPLIRSGAVALIETGIGYPNPCTITRVYESQAWRHWMLGRESREGMGWNTPRREWIVPNYYDVAEWPLATRPDLNRVVYLGRIEEAKGCAIIPVLARARPDLTFVMAGQGDPTPYLTEPNIAYAGALVGAERATFLGHARCSLHPSRFVEPFCGAAVEAMLCGTPVLTSDFGAFTETVINGTTGWRCGAEASWIAGLDRALALPRREVRASAMLRFSTEVVGPRYRAVFEELAATMPRRHRSVSTVAA